MHTLGLFPLLSGDSWCGGTVKSWTLSPTHSWRLCVYMATPSSFTFPQRYVWLECPSHMSCLRRFAVSYNIFDICWNFGGWENLFCLFLEACLVWRCLVDAGKAQDIIISPEAVKLSKVVLGSLAGSSRQPQESGCLCPQGTDICVSQ